MDAKRLSVKMFGKFSVKYGDEVLTFGGRGDSKFGQLFQILMTRPGYGFSKRNIAEALYDWDKVEYPNASLNNTIFRLRKYLETSPLPSGEYLYLNAGELRFAGEVEVESDVWSFEVAAREFKEEQDRRKKAELCEKNSELYQGEFLPCLSNEQWVIDKSKDYQKLYFEMMEYLFCFLKEESDYGKLERLSERVAMLYPYDGWEVWQLESLIAQNRHNEARELYQKIVVHGQKMGLFLPRERQEQLREMEGRLYRSEETEAEIRKRLVENTAGQGAYNCALQSFLDCFYMMKRNIRRETVHFCLFLCIILGTNGHPVKNYDYCEKQEKKLREVFQTHLRLGDIYAKYCQGQYLLLCVGIEKANASEISVRIDMDFRRRCGGRGGVSCRLLDDSEFDV